MKLMVWGILWFLTATVYAGNVQTNKESKVSHTEQMVGGWYPVFFDDYDQKRVDELVESLKTQSIAKVVISYEDNKNLAFMIYREVSSKVKCNLIMERIETKDNTAQFNHNRVVVVVYNKVY